jgi:asparagine synthase (glutamine-hydrolysing)
MARSLWHRGPDDEGVWIDAAQGVALGHRRLAILDLSQAGHQPMVSRSGRFVVAYNGEIYNFQELIRALEEDANCALRLRGHSDTEAMLACFERWGVEGSLARMNGMFAFVVWDRQERSLTLCRDRMGEKPLYYGWIGNSFLFGSELKALRLHPACEAKINREAVGLYLRYNCVPCPYSIFEGVQKLPPGSLLKVDGKAREEIAPTPYWSLREIAGDGVKSPLRCGDAELLARLEELLKDAVKIRMIADVPFGVFLSGGIDSSTVTALMQAQSARPVRTFSIGSEDPGFNEAEQAAAVAQHLGTDHTELYVTAEDALAAIPLMPTVYDEPFGDSSQIPTFLLSRLARKHVTVALSGDGGDELFAGYNRHVWIDRIWRAIGWVPGEYRRAVAEAIMRTSPGSWDRALRVLNPLLPSHLKQRYAGYKVHKLAGILGCADPEAMYAALVSHWNEPSAVLAMVKASARSFGERAGARLPTMLQEMLVSDALTYLPDDILVKVDRASMAVGLETRLPLLDHRVVEYSWKVPIAAKIREKKGKWALREILRRYVPSGLTDRPKAGFGIPLGDWLRGSLRDWAEALLDEKRLKREGFFNARPIREKWAEHLSGKAAWEHHLWDVLMFQAWLSTDRETEREEEPAIPAALAS